MLNCDHLKVTLTKGFMMDLNSNLVLALVYIRSQPAPQIELCLTVDLPLCFQHGIGEQVLVHYNDSIDVTETTSKHTFNGCPRSQNSSMTALWTQTDTSFKLYVLKECVRERHSEFLWDSHILRGKLRMLAEWWNRLVADLVLMEM